MFILSPNTEFVDARRERKKVSLRVSLVLDHQYVCVGTWIENFQTYFITRIIYPPGSIRKTGDDRYACFVILSLDLMTL